MTDKYDIIPATNPIDSSKKSPVAFVSFKNKISRRRDPANEALNVLLMEETGINRTTRKEKILSYFPDNSPNGAKTVEAITDKTTGFNHKQLSSLLNHIRLKDFRDEEKFVNVLNEGIQRAWLDDL